MLLIAEGEVNQQQLRELLIREEGNQQELDNLSEEQVIYQLTIKEIKRYRHSIEGGRRRKLHYQGQDRYQQKRGQKLKSDVQAGLKKQKALETPKIKAIGTNIEISKNKTFKDFPVYNTANFNKVKISSIESKVEKIQFSHMNEKVSKIDSESGTSGAAREIVINERESRTFRDNIRISGETGISRATREKNSISGSSRIARDRIVISDDRPGTSRDSIGIDNEPGSSSMVNIYKNQNIENALGDNVRKKFKKEALDFVSSESFNVGQKILISQHKEKLKRSLSVPNLLTSNQANDVFREVDYAISSIHRMDSVRGAGVSMITSKSLNEINNISTYNIENKKINESFLRKKHNITKMKQFRHSFEL